MKKIWAIAAQVWSWIIRQLHVVDVLLPGLWIWAWNENAAHGLHYDLDKLWTLYTTLRGLLLVQFGVNSKLNSPAGEPPK